MLNRQKVVDALQSKRDQFGSYQAGQRRQVARAREKLTVLNQLTASAILERLAEQENPWSGAEPTAEFDQATGLRMPFTLRWRSHADARSWALGVLRDRPVAAVDGSHIMPSKELSLPVAAVQVGWFINYHAQGGVYEKDVTFDVLGPEELTTNDIGAEFADWRVNLRRFELECEQLCALMSRFAAEPEDRRPIFLFDGSFIISFAGQLRPDRAVGYIRAVEKLLDTSAALRVPLIGFVDSSASKDVLTMVNVISGPPYLAGLTDGALLADSLPAWGDRSPFFVCARRDSLSENGKADFYRNVVFSYVRLAQDRAPARIELPLWLYETGRGEELIDIMRAECIVGAKGYPYAAETADAVAVLQMADRERFYAIFHQFAEAEDLTLHQSRKSLSKAIRRP